MEYSVCVFMFHMWIEGNRDKRSKMTGGTRRTWSLLSKGSISTSGWYEICWTVRLWDKLLTSPRSWGRRSELCSQDKESYDIFLSKVTMRWKCYWWVSLIYSSLWAGGGGGSRGSGATLKTSGVIRNVTRTQMLVVASRVMRE